MQMESDSRSACGAKMRGNPRSQSIDSLRGVSILMIMLLHALVLTDISYGPYMQLIIDRLSLGVPLIAKNSVYPMH